MSGANHEDKACQLKKYRYWAAAVLGIVTLAFAFYGLYHWDAIVDAIRGDGGQITKEGVAFYFITVAAWMGLLWLMVHFAISMIKIEDF